MIVIAAILNGLMTGAIYGLIASGLSVVFGMMRIFNFAHGDLFMLAMYAIYWLFTLFGLSPYISLFLVAFVFFIGGYFLEHILFNPLIRREGSEERDIPDTLLVSMGMGFFFANGATAAFTGDFRGVITGITWTSFSVGTLTVSAPLLIGAITSVVVIGGLWLFLNKTYLGRMMRAVSQDREMGALLGIDPYKVFDLSMAICCVLLVISAGVMMPFYYVSPGLGMLFSLKAFIIVVLGGLGSVGGAMAGGAIIALLESTAVLLVNQAYVDIVILAVFLLFLLLRPRGLFGIKGEF